MRRRGLSCFIVVPGNVRHVVGLRHAAEGTEWLGTPGWAEYRDEVIWWNVTDLSEQMIKVNGVEQQHYTTKPESRSRLWRSALTVTFRKFQLDGTL